MAPHYERFVRRLWSLMYVMLGVETRNEMDRRDDFDVARVLVFIGLA